MGGSVSSDDMNYLPLFEVAGSCREFKRAFAGMSPEPLWDHFNVSGYIPHALVKPRGYGGEEVFGRERKRSPFFPKSGLSSGWQGRGEAQSACTIYM